MEPALLRRCCGGGGSACAGEGVWVVCLRKVKHELALALGCPQAGCGKTRDDGSVEGVAEARAMAIGRT